MPVENSDRTLADSNEPAFFMPENEGENFENENVEKSMLITVENGNVHDIIDHTEKNVFNIDSLPWQTHHFATNKNKKFTPLFNAILKKYALTLDQPWNKELMRHSGKHPYDYHKFVLESMKLCEHLAKGDTEKFINEFGKYKKKIIDNPSMLRKDFWKGKKL